MNSFPGYVGVDMFFVLSGFLITNLLRVEFSETSAIKFPKFLKRRFLRLYPSLIIAIALGAVCARLLGGISPQFVADAAVAAFYLEPWFIAFANWDGGMFRHTWSLGIEEFFYLLWPLFFIFLMKFSTRTLVWIPILGLSLLLLPVVIGLIQYSPNAVTDYILRIGGIFLGCALSFFRINVPRSWSKILFILGLAGIVLSTLTSTAGLGSLVAALSTCALIVSFYDATFSTKGAPSFLFENPAIVWFGKISYELYLVHYILIVSMIWFMAGQSFTNEAIRNVLPTVGVVSIAIAYVVHLMQMRIRKVLGVTFVDVRNQSA
jgi:peptidoglycan/LPS O-acetylase OafA/YrhL